MIDAFFLLLRFWTRNKSVPWTIPFSNILTIRPFPDPFRDGELVGETYWADFCCYNTSVNWYKTETKISNIFLRKSRLYVRNMEKIYYFWMSNIASLEPLCCQLDYFFRGVCKFKTKIGNKFLFGKIDYTCEIYIWKIAIGSNPGLPYR